MPHWRPISDEANISAGENRKGDMPGCLNRLLGRFTRRNECKESEETKNANAGERRASAERREANTVNKHSEEVNRAALAKRKIKMYRQQLASLSPVGIQRKNASASRRHPRKRETLSEMNQHRRRQYATLIEKRKAANAAAAAAAPAPARISHSRKPHARASSANTRSAKHSGSTPAYLKAALDASPKELQKMLNSL